MRKQFGIGSDEVIVGMIARYQKYRRTEVMLEALTITSGTQKPPTHAELPHERPHTPQFAALVLRLVSQDPFLSQSAVPEPQL